MVEKKKRRKTFLQREWNATSYAQTPRLRMIREVPTSSPGSQFMKLACILCMSTHCHLWPTTWQGTSVSSLSLYCCYLWASVEIFSFLIWVTVCFCWCFRFSLILSKTKKLEVDMTGITFEKIDDIHCHVLCPTGTVSLSKVAYTSRVHSVL